MEEKVIIEDEQGNQEDIDGWGKVDKFLEEKTLAGLIVGLLEADKLLNSELKKQGYPGKTTDERIKSVKEKFSNLNGILEARQIRKKILDTKEFNITSLDIEDGINAYKQAILDLKSGSKSRLGFFERFIILLDYYLPSKWKIFRKILIYIFIILALIWFLANTTIGNFIIYAIILVVNKIFSWVLAVILLGLAVLLIIIASLIYFERRKRKNI